MRPARKGQIQMAGKSEAAQMITAAKKRHATICAELRRIAAREKFQRQHREQSQVTVQCGQRIVPHFHDEELDFLDFTDNSLDVDALMRQVCATGHWVGMKLAA